MSWYCIGTNVFSLVPTCVLYNVNMKTDSFLTLATGVASFIFHGVELDAWKIDFYAIRYTDVILANMLVIHTMHTLIHMARRMDNTIVTLPLVIYTASVGVLYRFILMISYGLICSAYVLWNYKMYNMLWYLAGIGIICSQVVFFMVGNAQDYMWFHGSHHIAAFMAQAAFIKSIKNTNATPS